MYFADKSVAIVGVGGMGKEIVRMFAREGVKNFFLADYNLESCINASIDVAEINGGGVCLANKIDVTSKKSRDAWVFAIKETAEKMHMSVDIFIYTAGIIGPEGKSKFITKWTDEDIDTLFSINTTAMMKFMITFTKTFFVPQKYGRIITIASMAGMTPESGSEMYDSSKAADIAFMRAFAESMDGMRERKAVDIKSNCIAPRMVRTGMTSGLEDHAEKMDSLLLRFKQSDMSEPSEVAEQVYCLLDGDHHGCIVDEKGYALLPILDSVMDHIYFV